MYRKRILAYTEIIDYKVCINCKYRFRVISGSHILHLPVKSVIVGIKVHYIFDISFKSFHCLFLLFTGNMHWGFWKTSSVIPGRKIFPVWEAAFIPTCFVRIHRSRSMGILALQLQLQRCLSRAGKGISCCFRHFRMNGRMEKSGEWRHRVTSQLILNGERAGYTGFASVLPVSRK